MQAIVSMTANMAGSAICVSWMTAKSTPMLMMMGSMPLLTTNLKTVMRRLRSIQMASMMKAKPLDRNSFERPKKRSKSDEPMVMDIITRSSSAVVMSVVSKAGTTKSPSLSSLSRRAVSMPKV